MGEAMRPADYDIVLDVFGQRLVVIFTQISFFFPTEIKYTAGDIRSMLNPGLHRLASCFPWVAGQVVCEGTTSTSTGTFRIRPLEPIPRMAIEDLRDRPQVLSMQQWRQRGFPMKELGENIFAPRNTSSGRPGETIAEVFQLQVSLVKGAVVMTFLGQHQALDGTGLAQVIRLFSKACLGVPFTDHELRVGNLAPENVVPLHGESWIPGPDLSHNIVKEPSELGVGSPRTVFHAGSGDWSLFNITAESARRLKSLASESVFPGSTYISTDDAITAFMWQALTRARDAHLHPSFSVKLARAVDVRTALGISPDHPGFVQHMTYHQATAGELSTIPLGEVATDLRAAIRDRGKLAEDAQSFATMVSRMPDKTKTSYIAGFDMSKDVMLSSWSNQKSYELDFGFGRAEAVRRPDFPSFPGLVYLLPKAPNGDIAIAVCLNEQDMQRLTSDEIMQQFTAYVG